MLLARRKPADALSWAKRGLALGEQISGSSMENGDLLRLKRELLTKLGRRDEAIEAAWTEFGRHPSEFSYEELMKYVPKAEKETWHKKAIEAAMGTDLDLLLPLLLETKELERLADVAGRSEDSALERVSHLTTEPAARKLEKTHPGIAARLWRAQGMRVLHAKKSKYYPEALENFRRARRCYEKAGLSSQWLCVVDQLRAGHHRKVGFMAGFEELVAGKPPRQKPSFLDEAKARWGLPQAASRK
jgi:tetratricopeptide (TPR) repeat protein